MLKDNNLLCDLCGEKIPETICEKAPYPECNGADGCGSCVHQQEDDVFVYVSKGKAYCKECVVDSEIN